MVTLTNPAIDGIEESLGHSLPGLYRKLLVDVGYGTFGSAIEINDPLRIGDLYASFFEDPSQLFAVYVPFGCNLRTQELWVIDTSMEAAASIWHETVPDDWGDEAWLRYDEWMMRYLEPLLGEQ